MRLTTTAFADHGVIPGEYAFGVVDPTSRVRLSANRNPDFTWTNVPAGARSLALVCHDPDVPSKGDDVNQEGRTVPASLPRVDFFHWVLVDLKPGTHGIARGAHSHGVTTRGKPGPSGPHGGRHGINDYTAWFAADKDMSGDYHGYDGPCPPWNDEIPHRYIFTLYALDVLHLELPARFTGAEARRAMERHVLAHSSLVGRYALNPDVSL